MLHLLKIMAILAAFFASTFILLKATGFITIVKIELWLTQAEAASLPFVATIIVALLFADLFIAVPTLTVTILSGYFLGFEAGAAAALAGMTLAAFTGYGLSRRFGLKIFKAIMKDDTQHSAAKQAFTDHGFIMILLARVMPILPEVTACLAGFTHMRLMRFTTAWAFSTVPYVLIAAYAGSISSLDNPTPAIFAAIGISGIMWVFWFIAKRRKLISL